MNMEKIIIDDENIFQFYGCYHFHCNNVDWWNAISAPGGEMGTHLAVRHIIITRHHVMWWYLAIVTSPAPAIVMWRVSSQQQQSDQIRAIISRKRWRVETQKQSDWFYFFTSMLNAMGLGSSTTSPYHWTEERSDSFFNIIHRFSRFLFFIQRMMRRPRGGDPGPTSVSGSWRSWSAPSSSVTTLTSSCGRL